MEISSKNLERFRSWVMERGRSDTTAGRYVLNVRTCGADPKGITHRLVSGDLAPNTLRCNRAALQAWATFASDDVLRKRLIDIRLPPARRVRTKQPLAVDPLRTLVRHIQSCDMRPGDEPMRHVLLIMALRGFRSGDVLRMRRAEVVRALATGKIGYEGKGRKRIEFSAQPIMAQLQALAEYKGWDRVRDLIGTGSPEAMSRKVWRAARRIAAQIGITEMNPHRFRHTFATNFLNQLKGDPNAIVKLQKHMQWESIGTAARYVDAVNQDELDAIGDGLASDLLQ